MSNDRDMIFVKQQGAMRTGTNLVKFALEENFTNVHVLVNIGRWKHATADRPFNWHGTDWEGEGVHVDVLSRISPNHLAAARDAFDAGTIKFAISVRSVYSWIESWIRFTRPDETLQCHQPGAVATGCTAIENLPDDSVIEAVKEWNRLYRSYAPLLKDQNRAILFRFEDMMVDFEGTLQRASLAWNLRKRHLAYVQPDGYLRAGIDGESRSELLEPGARFDRAKYLEDILQPRFSDAVLNLVRQNLDRDVLSAYGYEVL